MSNNISNLSVLVTGGAGFIGSHIVEYLLNNGVKQVRILDNLSTGSMSNIKHLVGKSETGNSGIAGKFKNLEFMWGDICSLETCRKACVGMSVICHQAALGSVPRSIDDPLSSHNVNVNGFVHIIVAAKESGIKRIVYASSSSVYGTNDSPTKIEANIGDELSPYAVTKHVDELYGAIFTKVYGMECIGLRYFNVFGPRQNPAGAYAAVIPKFIKAMIGGEPITINGDGTYSRDFTYVDNVVHANILALTTANIKCFSQVFNVGTNNSISINQLFDMIKKLINNDKLVATYGPIRKGDVPYSNASIYKITSMLNYKPKIYFEEGLKKTIDFFSAN